MGLTHRRSVLSLYLVTVAFTIVALIAYVGRSWQVGFALISLTAVLIAVVRFVGYFGTTIVNADRVGDKTLEPLRRSVPRALRRMATASSLEQLPGLLAELGAESGLLAIRIVNPKNLRLSRWGWESPGTDGQPTREAVSANFEISDGQETLELQFFMDVAAVSPQVRILLQLVADAAETILALPREAIRTPKPSHVDRLARGGE